MLLTNLVHLNETPWKGLGTQYEQQPRSMIELVEKANLDWEVGALPMVTELHDHIPNYSCIYRLDNNGVLGVVNSYKLQPVQNAEMFSAFEYLLGNKVDVETASSFDGGRTVFGSFKIREQYKLLDDDIDHYFVVVNDHLKVDGKVSVLNTPVRVVCQNTLELAMSRNFYNLRIPVSGDAGINQSISASILENVASAILDMQNRAEEMFKKKVDLSNKDKIVDELFPFPDVDADSVLHSKAMEAIEILRDTFQTECLDADNLDNYRGTQWHMYNALADFDQHVYKKADNAYDLGYRMKRLTGVGTPAEPSRAAKYLKIMDQFAA